MSRHAFAIALAGLLTTGAVAACSGGGSSAGDGPDAGEDGHPVDGTLPDAPGDGSAAGDDAGSDAPFEATIPDASAGDERDSAAALPVVLASDVPNPSLLVTDGVYLYWTDFVATDAGVALGRVMKLPVGGGTEITLATEVGRFPSGLAVDGVNVYWVDDGATVFAARLDGGVPLTLYTGAGQGSIAADGQFVYVESSSGAGVARVPVDGGAAVTLATSDAGSAPAGLAIDPSNVYWPAPAAGAIVAVPKGGGATTTLVSNGEAGVGAFVSTTDYQNVVSDGTAVYWNLQPGGPLLPGGVLSITLDGGELSLLYDAGAAAPSSIVTDGVSVYFLVGGNAPALVKAPIDGGAPVVLAASQFSAGITGDPGPTVAVDATNVYWLSPPQILKIGK